MNNNEFDLYESGSIIKPFSDVLFEFVTKEQLGELKETMLELTEDVVSSMIPQAQIFYTIGKAAKNFQAWFEWKNQYVFLLHLHNGDVKRSDIEKRNKAYKNKEKWVLREVETLVVYLSKNTSVIKAKLQAELYIDYINGHISEEKFLECLDVIHHLFLSDVPHLLEIYSNEKEANLTESDFPKFHEKIKTAFDTVKCRRLMSSGLLVQLHPMSFGFTVNNYFITSDTGKYMCELLSRESIKLLE